MDARNAAGPPIRRRRRRTAVAVAVAAAATVLALAAGGALWWLTRPEAGPRTAGEVRLTLSFAAHETGLRELVNNKLGVAKGAVVAIDPATGALLAAVSTPVPGSTGAVGGGAVLDAARRALANGAFSQAVAPGSAFEVIVSAAVLNTGLTPASAVPGGDQYQIPGSTAVIRNPAGVACPSQLTLEQALTVSCTTAFARLCPTVGAAGFASTAHAFGFEEPRGAGNPPSLFTDDGKDLLRTPGSSTGTMSDNDKLALAQTCIGQRDVRMTPLQGCLMAAAVANGGRQMRPYLVQEKRAADRSVRYTATPQELRHPVSGRAADGLRNMMINVVDNGTGRAAQIRGAQVGGKTGTVQTEPDQQAHGWFIGFAMKNGKPVVAVAVLLQNAGQGASTEATRIAAEVMKAVIAERG